jgi:molybdate transport system substrate-binding protein
MRTRLISLVFVLLFPFVARAADLNVFAAASLSDALREIANSYEPASGDRLRYNFGASSTLSLQIKQGAPADLFFSADEAKVDELAKANLIATDTRVSLLSNTLVIVVNADRGAAISKPDDLAKPTNGRIALAEPETVPAGVYAKEWLQRIGLWKKISDRVVPTENVRACLAAVEAGNADAGIVYKTDALTSKKVKIVHEVSGADGPKISYPLAVLKDTKHGDAARKFAAYLAGPEARAVFVKYGFLAAK